MANGITLKKLPNGDLEITVDDPSDLDSAHDIGDVLDSGRYIGNGWDVVDAEATNCGDLTEAPMIAEDATLEDDDSWTFYGDIWWFPNYQIEDPVETLRQTGRVVFKLGHPAGTLSRNKGRVASDCECGARAVGVGDGMPGHSGWCPARAT